MAMSPEDSNISCAQVPPDPARKYWMQCGKSPNRVGQAEVGAGLHGNNASELMEPELNERLVPAADQRRFASAARRRRLAQSYLWLACLWLACLALALV